MSNLSNDNSSSLNLFIMGVKYCSFPPANGREIYSRSLALLICIIGIFQFSMNNCLAKVKQFFLIQLRNKAFSKCDVFTF